jgi:hypothetical protein
VRAGGHTEPARIRLVLDIHGAHGVTRPTRIAGDHMAVVSNCTPPG